MAGVAERHIPVMLEQAVDALNVKAGGVYVDGTLGRAGHTREIVRRGGTVIGIDRDDDALRAVGEMKVPGLKAVTGRHGDIAEILKKERLEEVDGILLDLGVSSPQLDEGRRGFSFNAEGPHDKRMDRTGGMTAAELVRTGSEDELTNIFRTLGEEPNARRIAKAIVCARAGRMIETTLQLAGVVESAIGRHGAHHPATRVFQALRMAVNDELGELTRALSGGLGSLRTGGTAALALFNPLSGQWSSS